MCLNKLYILVKCSSFLSRIGFVFVLNTDKEVHENEDAGVALWRAFNFIADELDIPNAFAAVIKVSICKQIKIVCLSWHYCGFHTYTK